MADVGYTVQYCATCEGKTIHAISEGVFVIKLCLVCTKKHYNEQLETENE